LFGNWWLVIDCWQEVLPGGEEPKHEGHEGHKGKGKVSFLTHVWNLCGKVTVTSEVIVTLHILYR
jgi:hypothetical protein